MKVLILVAAMLLMIGALNAEASDSSTTMEYQIVVDRTMRSKVVNDYVLLTRDAIQRAWKTPLDLAADGSVKGRIRVNYIVTRTGGLEGVELIQGSGNADMDRGLLNAIRVAQPFPPFPDEIRASRILVRANFIVAELPTADVTRVSQPMPQGDQPKIMRPNLHQPVIDRSQMGSRDPQSPAAQKPKIQDPNLMWGRPAGTSKPQDDKAEPQGKQPPALPTPEPDQEQLRWGRQ